MPAYKDGAYGSVGMGAVFTEGWTGGVSADFSQATSSNLDDVYGGSVFIGHKVNSRFSVNLFAGYDNTDTTSVGLGLSYKLK